MMNQIVIIGRYMNIADAPEYGEGAKNITITCPRSEKNSEGVYLTDVLTINISGNIAQNAMEYLKKGDIIGIKGKLLTREYSKNKKTIREQYVSGEKITFLSSSSSNKED